MVAVVAIPAATFLRSPVTTTTRTAGGRVTGAPRGGIVALPRSSRAVSLGRGRSSTVVRCVAWGASQPVGYDADANAKHREMPRIGSRAEARVG